MQVNNDERVVVVDKDVFERLLSIAESCEEDDELLIPIKRHIRKFNSVLAQQYQKERIADLARIKENKRAVLEFLKVARNKIVTHRGILCRVWGTSPECLENGQILGKIIHDDLFYHLNVGEVKDSVTDDIDVQMCPSGLGRSRIPIREHIPLSTLSFYTPNFTRPPTHIAILSRFVTHSQVVSIADEDVDRLTTHLKSLYGQARLVPISRGCLFSQTGTTTCLMDVPDDKHIPWIPVLEWTN